MSVPVVLSGLRQNRAFMRQVAAWETLPARPARYAPLAADLHPALAQALAARGMGRLYAHQAKAIDAALAGDHVVVATATASGKTLCYTVPVLQALLTDPGATALYLFPTKALAHDQLDEGLAFIHAADLPVRLHAYDGDTPTRLRAAARANPGILITNPDMLHAGILPYHTQWRDFLSRLRFVVVDEIHTYRGVFGSHVANVLRRLGRLCAFYGSAPHVIACSATIANPREHAERLVEHPFTLVDEADNGAPAPARHVVLYNPPIVDELLGLRQSMVLAARDAASLFLAHDVQTVVFARARQTVELLLTYLQEEPDIDPASIRGYRGGYLPLERREIERGLREGEVRGVVATNALELGVDIGALGAAVLAGYPGSIAATWQRAGRAGRRDGEPAAVILVAGNSALDQYLCRHPRYLFGRSPEHALINPDNPRILSRHLLCAAFELPFARGEAFGGAPPDDLADLLDALAAAGLMHQTGRQTHYLGEGAPASGFSLRTSGGDNVIIQDVSGDTPRVVGELELESAPLMIYEGAVYFHQAQAYLVDELDWEGRLAAVRPVDVDYYTRATVSTEIRRLAPEAEVDEQGVSHAYGETEVVTQATAYRKIRRYTYENLGQGPIDLPATTLDTTAYWLVLGEALTEELIDAGILLAPNDYGPAWPRQRQLAIDRDGARCRTCGATAADTGGLHVHHLRPFREFVWDLPPTAPRDEAFYARANHLNNLITLCPSCHRRAESGQGARSALGGLAYALGNLAPLFLMCDPGDIAVTAESRSPLTGAPTLVVYERIPAGVGFSKRLFAQREELLAAALDLVADCTCRDGCPACVGPPGDIGPDTKDLTRRLLTAITGP